MAVKLNGQIMVQDGWVITSRPFYEVVIIHPYRKHDADLSDIC